MNSKVVNIFSGLTIFIVGIFLLKNIVIEAKTNNLRGFDNIFSNKIENLIQQSEDDNGSDGASDLNKLNFFKLKF